MYLSDYASFPDSRPRSPVRPSRPYTSPFPVLRAVLQPTTEASRDSLYVDALIAVSPYPTHTIVPDETSLLHHAGRESNRGVRFPLFLHPVVSRTCGQCVIEEVLTDYGGFLVKPRA